jgi:hypothetical protein
LTFVRGFALVYSLSFRALDARSLTIRYTQYASPKTRTPTKTRGHRKDAMMIKLKMIIVKRNVIVASIAFRSMSRRFRSCWAYERPNIITVAIRRLHSSPNPPNCRLLTGGASCRESTLRLPNYIFAQLLAGCGKSRKLQDSSHVLAAPARLRTARNDKVKDLTARLKSCPPASNWILEFFRALLVLTGFS